MRATAKWTRDEMKTKVLERMERENNPNATVSSVNVRIQLSVSATYARGLLKEMVEDGTLEVYLESWSRGRRYGQHPTLYWRTEN